MCFSMVRRTLGQVKPMLAQTAGQSGMPVTDALLTEYVNNAVQELMNEGDWPGVVDRWHFRFNEATALVTLPFALERLIDVTVDDVPLEIRSPWYEFVQYGPGIQREVDQDRDWRRAWVNVVMDRGQVVTQHPLPDLPSPWTLNFTPLETESTTAQINVQGLDSSGNFIRTFEISSGTNGSWVNGENITLSSGTGTYSTVNQFASILSIQKPVTNGPITLTATNGSTTIPLSVYQFDEIAPLYRQYFIPHLWRQDTTNYPYRIILARCRRRFVPVSEDTDSLMIGNILALQQMMRAQWFRNVPDPNQEAICKANAIDLMRKEAQAYMGKARVPSLTFQRGNPIGAMQYLR